MEDNDILAEISAADRAATLPRIVYDGPVNGPGTRLVLIFDCPATNPDGHGYQFGVLFLVVAKPDGPDITVYPAALTPDDETLVGRPYGPVLGISDRSAADALRDAREATR